MRKILNQHIKILVLLFFVPLIMTSCFDTAIVKQPPVDPVCPKEGSWLCEKSAELGIELETLYDWIYSATALSALVPDGPEIAEICRFEKEIADFYERSYPISTDYLINEIIRRSKAVDDTAKAVLIKNIINKNLVQFRSLSLITPADDEILRKGHRAFRMDMMCDAFEED